MTHLSLKTRFCHKPHPLRIAELKSVCQTSVGGLRKTHFDSLPLHGSCGPQMYMHGQVSLLPQKVIHTIELVISLAVNVALIQQTSTGILVSHTGQLLLCT